MYVRITFPIILLLLKTKPSWIGSANAAVYPNRDARTQRHLHYFNIHNFVTLNRDKLRSLPTSLIFCINRQAPFAPAPRAACINRAPLTPSKLTAGWDGPWSPHMPTRPGSARTPRTARRRRRKRRSPCPQHSRPAPGRPLLGRRRAACTRHRVRAQPLQSPGRPIDRGLLPSSPGRSPPAEHRAASLGAGRGARSRGRTARLPAAGARKPPARRKGEGPAAAPMPRGSQRRNARPGEEASGLCAQGLLGAGRGPPGPGRWRRGPHSSCPAWPKGRRGHRHSKGRLAAAPA